MKKYLKMLLSKKRQSLVALWEKVVAYYLIFKEKPSVKTLIKFASWLLLLILKIIIKILLSKLFDAFFDE